MCQYNSVQVLVLKIVGADKQCDNFFFSRVFFLRYAQCVLNTIFYVRVDKRCANII